MVEDQAHIFEEKKDYLINIWDEKFAASKVQGEKSQGLTRRSIRGGREPGENPRRCVRTLTIRKGLEMKLRFFVCIGLAALLSAPVAAAALEDGFNRPGADYHSFRLSSPDPMVCQDACNRDPKCQSFTYVRPGVQGPQAVCWLKSGVPAPIPHNCCISGLKTECAAGSGATTDHGA